MAKHQAPITCVSVLVCDDVFRDQGTSKLALWGTFNEISARSVPVKHPRLCVFASITNGRGTRDVRICIEKASNSEPVVQIGGPMQFGSPLDIVDINIVLRGIVFAEFGKYWVCVKEGERVLGQRPFHVRRQSKGKNKGRKGSSDEHGNS